jgi:hypothetical protein
LSESEHGTLVDRRFDTEIVFDPPGGRLLAWEPFPSEYFFFGQQIDGRTKDSKGGKYKCAAKDHSVDR